MALRTIAGWTNTLIVVLEHVRLDNQAMGLAELMKGNLVHATLRNPSKILDIGCGTGIVTRHLAQQYPTATVYGIDISDVPTRPDTPGNITFINGDIQHLAGSDERLKDGTVDYIFQRLLVCGMTGWPAYIQQMTRLLRPGGYLEVHDFADIFYKNDHIISGDWKWLNAMRRGAAQLGLDLEVGLNARKYLTDAGLVDVQVVKYDVPLGTWMADAKPETKRLGEHQAPDMAAVFSSSGLPNVTRDLGIGEEEMEALKEECEKCLGGEEGKYFCFYVTNGRKV